MPTNEEIEAGMRAVEDVIEKCGLEHDFVGMMVRDALDAAEKVRAAQSAYGMEPLDAMWEAADQVSRIASKMTSPNAWTSQFITIAIRMRQYVTRARHTAARDYLAAERVRDAVQER